MLQLRTEQLELLAWAKYFAHPKYCDDPEAEAKQLLWLFPKVEFTWRGGGGGRFPGYSKHSFPDIAVFMQLQLFFSSTCKEH